MKVWNKDVDDCCLCPYLGNYSMNEGAYCKFSKKDIEDINIIPKHCPFAQQITKEVIEGFGFTKLPEYFSASSAYILETDKLFFPYSIGYKINYLIESHSDNTFIIFKFRYIVLFSSYCKHKASFLGFTIMYNAL